MLVMVFELSSQISTSAGMNTYHDRRLVDDVCMKLQNKTTGYFVDELFAAARPKAVTRLCGDASASPITVPIWE